MVIYGALLLNCSVILLRSSWVKYLFAAYNPFSSAGADGAGLDGTAGADGAGLTGEAGVGVDGAAGFNNDLYKSFFGDFSRTLLNSCVAFSS